MQQICLYKLVDLFIEFSFDWTAVWGVEVYKVFYSVLSITGLPNKF